MTLAVGLRVPLVDEDPFTRMTLITTLQSVGPDVVAEVLRLRRRRIALLLGDGHHDVGA